MRRFAATALLISLVALARPAAAILPHITDLTTAFIEAEAVAWVKRRGVDLESGALIPRRFTVAEVLEGPLAVGEAIDGDVFYFEPWEEDPRPTRMGDAVLFLLRRDDAWVIIHARVVVDGLVRRHVGMMGVTVQTCELSCDDRREPLGVEAFARELSLARSRARDAEALLAAADVEARAPTSSAPVMVGRLLDLARGADRTLGQEIVQRLERLGDLEDLLEAMGRFEHPSGDQRLHRVAATELVGRAVGGPPVSRRVMALSVLANDSTEIDATDRHRLLALLDDPEPAIRAAVTPLLWPARLGEGALPALRARWAVEADPEVLLALLRQARLLERRSELVPERSVVLSAARERGALVLRWEVFRDDWAAPSRLAINGVQVPISPKWHGAHGQADGTLAIPLDAWPGLAGGLTIHLGVGAGVGSMVLPADRASASGPAVPAPSSGSEEAVSSVPRGAPPAAAPSCAWQSRRAPASSGWGALALLAAGAALRRRHCTAMRKASSPTPPALSTQGPAPEWPTKATSLGAVLPGPSVSTSWLPLAATAATGRSPP